MVGIFGDDIFCALAGIVVEPGDPTSGLVFVQRLEGTGLFLAAALQKCIADKIMGIGQKVRLLHRVIARKAIQHGEDTPHFVVQEPLRVIAFQPLPHQETANTAIEPGFIVVQEEGEVVQVSLPQGGSDVIVECFCLRRLRVKLKDARRLPHSQPLRLGQKTISGAVAVQRPSKFHFRHFLTAFLWHYKAIRLFASASRASWVISCSYLVLA